MKGIIYFDICALVLLIGIVTIFYMRKNTPCVRNRLYKIILWMIIVSTILNIIITVMQNHGIYFKNISIIMKLLYYYTHTSIPLFFCAYYVVFIDDYKNIDKYKLILILLPTILLESIITTTPFTKLIFYYSDGGEYFKGSLFYLCYAVMAYYFILTMIYIFINRKKYKNFVKFLLYTFLLLVIFPIMIQNYFDGYMLENFAATICALLLLMTVESVDILIDSNTNMYTQTALLNTIGTYYNSNTSFEAIVIKNADLELIIDKLGLKLINNLFREVSDYLSKVVKTEKGYFINNECFVFIYTNENTDIENVILEIQNRMKKPWYICDLEIKVTEYICRINAPKDADNKELFLDYIEYIQNIKKSENSRISLKEINLKGRKRRIQIENAIKYALDNDTFEVYYQPIYSLEKKMIISAEALVRLKDPVLGDIGPDEFITIAEESCYIIKLGKIVFRKVCEFISTYNIKELGIEYIEVNLSIIQCMQVNLVSEFKEILDEYHVDPRQICLEITETAAENAPDVLARNINELKELGISFALDDYGTGYSNLQKMVDLPFTYVKYDRVMIWSAMSNPRAKIAVESSMSLIKKLGMKVIAEGVETIQHLEELKKMDCDYIQGYYFSKAIPGEEFAQYMRTQIRIKRSLK